MMRKRRVAKWVGTAMSLGLIVLAVIARQRYLFDHQGRFVWGYEGGMVYTMWVCDLNGDISMDDGPEGVWPQWDFMPGYGYCAIPEWLIFTIVVAPTALLWWSDRRRHPPNHCQACGYNLTGNVSGACPECGTEIDAKGASE